MRKFRAVIITLVFLTIIILFIPIILFPNRPFKDALLDYNIGTSTINWQLKKGAHKGTYLVAQIWYPTDIKTGSTANYLPKDLPIKSFFRDVLELPYLSFLADHFKKIRTEAFSNAPLSSVKSKFPIIIFSPGLGGNRFQATFFAHYLASRGFAFIALDHIGTSMATELADKSFYLYDKNIPWWLAIEERNKLARERTIDITELIDNLRDNQLHSFTNRLNLDLITVFGHSLGGTTALLACQLDNRIKACASLDGGIQGLEALANVSQPLLYIEAENWPELSDNELKKMNITREYIDNLLSENDKTREKLFNPSQTKNAYIKLQGSRHYNFTDLPIIFRGSWLIELIGPVDAKEILFFTAHKLLVFLGAV